MSIAMNRIDRSGYVGGRGEGGGGGVAGADVYEPQAICDEKGEEQNWCSSSSSSSIGRNSDLSGRSTEGEDSEENEVQSCYKGPFLMMDSLEEALPIRRGISTFYSGKSKSFTSLAEASSASSVKDIAKQENAYTRRRRNLLAVNHIWDKTRCSPLRNISKRPISSSKSLLALAVAMSSSDSISSTSEDSSSNSRSPPRLPPLHPQSGGRASAWRSYSLADLQQCSTADTISSSYFSYITDKTDFNKKPI